MIASNMKNLFKVKYIFLKTHLAQNYKI